MRRIALSKSLPCLLPLILGGCTGFGTFLDHTFTLPNQNPNLPMADSENIRRVLGRSPDPNPLEPEPGNVWPGAEQPEPTLRDLQQDPQDRRGFAPTTVPGERPGLPASHQPRPLGSSTPPGDAPGNDALGASPQAITPQPRLRTSVPGPGPTGTVVQTPSGPAVDAGGSNLPGGYRTLTTPQGPGAIMVPNGNGTSTIINPNGTVQTVPTPR